MDAKTLFIYDFDNMENRDALYLREQKIFVDDKNGTAHKKIDDYLRSLKETPYLGWDGKVYPEFVIKNTTIY